MNFFELLHLDLDGIFEQVLTSMCKIYKISLSECEFKKILKKYFL